MRGGGVNFSLLLRLMVDRCQTSYQPKKLKSLAQLLHPGHTGMQLCFGSKVCAVLFLFLLLVVLLL